MSELFLGPLMKWNMANLTPAEGFLQAYPLHASGSYNNLSQPHPFCWCRACHPRMYTMKLKVASLVVYICEWLGYVIYCRPIVICFNPTCYFTGKMVSCGTLGDEKFLPCIIFLTLIRVSTLYWTLSHPYTSFMHPNMVESITVKVFYLSLFQ